MLLLPELLLICIPIPMRMTSLCCPFFIIARQAVVVFSSSKILFDSSWSISLHSSMLLFDSFFSFLSKLIVDLNDLMPLPYCLVTCCLLAFCLSFDLTSKKGFHLPPDLTCYGSNMSGFFVLFQNTHNISFPKEC